MVRSIAHEICTMIAMTGSSNGHQARLARRSLAYGRPRAEYTLPHLVLSGPSFPGDLGVAVARTGVQRPARGPALRRGALDRSDIERSRTRSEAASPRKTIVDRYLLRRAAARVDLVDERSLDAHA